MAQLAGAAEYTNCISAEGLNYSNECSGYDTKQSDGEVPVMLEYGVILQCNCSLVHSDLEGYYKLPGIYVCEFYCFSRRRKKVHKKLFFNDTKSGIDTNFNISCFCFWRFMPWHKKNSSPDWFAPTQNIPTKLGRIVSQFLKRFNRLSHAVIIFGYLSSKLCIVNVNIWNGFWLK